MTYTSTLKTLVMISLFALISTSDLSITPTFGQDCPDTKETDAAIVKSIYDKIKSHRNKKLAPQLSHINITSNKRVVKIQGWVENKKAKKSLLQYCK